MSDRPNDTKSMALFCDFENIALGVRDSKFHQFDISKVLERLLLKGSIVVKKAYCDWERYREFKAAMHQASFELIEIPHLRMSGKNSADIRMVVDALDLCYTKSHVDTFVIISGDSDFSPLVSKLRENAKTVIGVGVKNSTSELLINNCDEFIYYDDLVRAPARPVRRRSADRSIAATVPDSTPFGTPTAAPAALPTTMAVAPKTRAKTKPAAAAAAVSPVAIAVPAAAVGPVRRRRGSRKSVAALDATNVEPDAALADDGAAWRAKAMFSASDAPADVPNESSRASNLDEAPDEGADEVRDQQSYDRMQQALDLVVSTIEALAAERGEDEKIWGSMVKQTLKRRKPGFNESYYGFRSFNRLLEEARERGLIELDLDDKSGGYTVRSLA